MAKRRPLLDHSDGCYLSTLPPEAHLTRETTYHRRRSSFSRSHQPVSPNEKRVVRKTNKRTNQKQLSDDRETHNRHGTVHFLTSLHAVHSINQDLTFPLLFFFCALCTYRARALPLCITCFFFLFPSVFRACRGRENPRSGRV